MFNSSAKPGVATNLLMELLKLPRERKVSEIHIIRDPRNAVAPLRNGWR